MAQTTTAAAAPDLVFRFHTNCAHNLASRSRAVKNIGKNSVCSRVAVVGADAWFIDALFQARELHLTRCAVEDAVAASSFVQATDVLPSGGCLVG